MNRQLYDANHTEIAVALNNLAMVRHDQGQLDAAETMYRESVAIRAEAYGKLNPEYAIQVNNLAFLLYDKGDVAGALNALGEALQIYRSTRLIAPARFWTRAFRRSTGEARLRVSRKVAA